MQSQITAVDYLAHLFGILTGLVDGQKEIKATILKLATDLQEFQSRSHREYGDLISLLVRNNPIFESSPYNLTTSFPIALNSHDHIFPLGTKQDNTRYPRFIERCHNLFGRKIRAMDLGCAGGGLVLDFLLAGHQAIGVEGSSYPLVNQLAQWRWLKHRLFNCDITKPFQVTDASLPGVAQFEIISAWEVLEHIQEVDLPQLLANIRAHLRHDGYFVASIATFECSDPASGAVWHVTVKPREWWAKRFREAGLEPVSGLFDVYDFPRGSGNGPMDWDAVKEPQQGFHLVARPI